MNLERWSTRTPAPAGFAERWEAWLANAPLANFSMGFEHAKWEATAGGHATLVLAELDGRRMALVLRERGGELHCGWPWRWQAVMCDEGASTGPAPTDAESALLFRAAQVAAEGSRVCVHLPADPGRRAPGYRTGVTLVQRLDVPDAEILEHMDANKRRLYRRAQREGFVVREALARRHGSRSEDLEALARLTREATRLRAEPTASSRVEERAADAWREWELPWMHLLVAERGGVIEACIGDGIRPGAMVEGRAAVTTPEARKAGVMALLCYEEVRLHRDSGHRWLNHGGDTVFKREVAGTLGTPLVMYGWLGGGVRHALANRSAAWLWRTRPTIAAWLRSAGRALPRSLSRRPVPDSARGGDAAAAPPGPRVAAAESKVRRWLTGEALDPAFDRAWRARLTASGRASWDMRLDWLQSEAAAGRPAEALLVDEPDLRAALVLRHEAEGRVCGSSRGPQFVLEDAPDSAAGAEGQALRRLSAFLSLQPVAVRLYLPRVRGGPAGERGGRIWMCPIRLEEAAWFELLPEATRRLIRAARDAGWGVALAESEQDREALRAFLERQPGSGAADDGRARTIGGGAAAAPWEWCMTARKGGELHGYARYAHAPGGAVEAVGFGFSEACRQEGGNVLLAWQALQHARAEGCRWMNWGGATRFDRQFGGEPVEFDAIVIGGKPRHDEDARDRAETMRGKGTSA